MTATIITCEHCDREHDARRWFCPHCHVMTLLGEIEMMSRPAPQTDAGFDALVARLYEIDEESARRCAATV